MGPRQLAEEEGGDHRGRALELVRHGLDGVRVLHTLFRRWVTPLAKRTRPMWKYNGLTDPDRTSPKELPNNEVWSRLDWVLQLKAKEDVNGKPAPFNSAIMSKLVCSLLSSPRFFLCFPIL